jgi:hypothetical protein
MRSYPRHEQADEMVKGNVLDLIVWQGTSPGLVRSQDLVTHLDQLQVGRSRDPHHLPGFGHDSTSAKERGTGHRLQVQPLPQRLSNRTSLRREIGMWVPCSIG